MNRRSFLQAFAATASRLLLPEPRRVYSFARELRVPGVDRLIWTGPYAGGLYQGFSVSHGLAVTTLTPFDADVSLTRKGVGLYEVSFHRLDERPISMVSTQLSAQSGDRCSIITGVNC